jgi:hypothetical protein
MVIAKVIFQFVIVFGTIGATATSLGKNQNPRLPSSFFGFF